MPAAKEACNADVVEDMERLLQPQEDPEREHPMLHRGRVTPTGGPDTDAPGGPQRCAPPEREQEPGTTAAAPASCYGESDGVPPGPTMVTVVSKDGFGRGADGVGGGGGGAPGAAPSVAPTPPTTARRPSPEADEEGWFLVVTAASKPAPPAPAESSPR